VCAIMSVLCLRICQVCAVGFLTAMMWLLCVIAVVRNIRTLDEMGKRIHLQAASIAFVATVILNYVFFGLETARICALKATDPLSKKRDEAIRTTCPYYRQPLLWDYFRFARQPPAIPQQAPRTLHRFYRTPGTAEASYTVLPPTTVSRTWIFAISSAGTSSGLRSSMMMSANLPTSIDPVASSS